MRNIAGKEDWYRSRDPKEASTLKETKIKRKREGEQGRTEMMQKEG
jgi:hypothetical protein